MSKSRLSLIVAGCFLATLGTAPAFGAGHSSVASLLSGNRVPLVLTLGNLNSHWRVFEIGGGGPGRTITDVIVASVRGTGGYYTKGQTVRIDGVQYLVAYHQAPRAPSAILGNLPEPLPPITADTRIEMTLVNLRTTTMLSNVHPFNLKQEIEDRQVLIAAIARLMALASHAKTAIQGALQ
jgi:hypothetical protein